mmetsp:Transcript_3816/g.7766  ORF Transcript_3816/g.7766 Transcript_3816/m.7766 type:complete len:102 (+) Transcript_3816:312-617(+)
MTDTPHVLKGVQEIGQQISKTLTLQRNSKKKVCTLYSALSYKDDTVPQVKICKSKKKDKHRYTAATIAYKYTATCWLPNLPSNYCYNVAAKIGSHKLHKRL